MHPKVNHKTVQTSLQRRQVDSTFLVEGRLFPQLPRNRMKSKLTW